MKIQLETVIRGGGTPTTELNKVIRHAEFSKDMNELILRLENTKFLTLAFGRGSDHVWIKQLDLSGQTNERILLITEN